jgi:hypothetical protein
MLSGTSNPLYSVGTISAKPRPWSLICEGCCFVILHILILLHTNHSLREGLWRRHRRLQGLDVSELPVYIVIYVSRLPTLTPKNACFSTASLNWRSPQSMGILTYQLALRDDHAYTNSVFVLFVCKTIKLGQATVFLLKKIA